MESVFDSCKLPDNVLDICLNNKVNSITVIAFTYQCGRFFQWLTTFFKKEYFLVTNLDLVFNILYVCPRLSYLSSNFLKIVFSVVNKHRAIYNRFKY